MNYWLRSELDCTYYNKQTPMDILIKLSSTTDDVYVFHLLNFFIVIFIFIGVIIICTSTYYSYLFLFYFFNKGSIT